MMVKPLIELFILGPAMDKTMLLINGSSSRDFFIRIFRESEVLIRSFRGFIRAFEPTTAEQVLILVPPISMRRTLFVCDKFSGLTDISTD